MTVFMQGFVSSIKRKGLIHAARTSPSTSDIHFTNCAVRWVLCSLMVCRLANQLFNCIATYIYKYFQWKRRIPVQKKNVTYSTLRRRRIHSTLQRATMVSGIHLALIWLTTTSSKFQRPGQRRPEVRRLKRTVRMTKYRSLEPSSSPWPSSWLLCCFLHYGGFMTALGLGEVSNKKILQGALRVETSVVCRTKKNLWNYRDFI
jgi:hypothetical protein